jgi:threonine/homoserine/homoserine lactone efflux protein
VIAALVLGAGFAFSAVVQPGPLQAFLLARVAASGWRRTLPASLAPLLSDGPIALLALLVLGQMPLMVQQALRGAGGLLLIYLAWVTFRQWRAPDASEELVSAPRTLLDAALVNLLNPHPYLGWTLVLGPSVVTAWQRDPTHAVALVVAFYGTMVLSLAGFIALAGTARLMGARVMHTLVGVAAAVLAGLGLFLIVSALWLVWSP